MEENLKLKIDYEELVNLIKKTQKGDTKAKDKLYSLLIDEMKVIANKYLSKYHYLSNDESEYNFLVFTFLFTFAKKDNSKVICRAFFKSPFIFSRDQL